MRAVQGMASAHLRLLVATSLVLGFDSRLAQGEIVLNEIHHSPDVKTERVEFIELYNRGTAPVDMAGWRFSAGIDYVFPPGATVPPGGYLVVAQQPSELKAKFGVDALGPWIGRLDGQGERVELRDAAGQVVDSVDYGLGFPWPTVGDTPGYSIELIDPAQDNDLGGHWRASVVGGGQQHETLLSDTGSTWLLHKGTAAPPSDWPELTFDDSGWTAGPAPVGYDSAVHMGTPLNDMRSGYLDFFLRRTFPVTDAARVSALSLEVLYDDGFKLWLNGVCLLSQGMPAGTVPYNQAANPVRESDAYDLHEVALPAGLLREGDNVLAVQVANANLGNSSDAFFDCRVRAVIGPSGRGPTPGRINVTFASEIPPALRQVEHQPRQPHPGEPVRISVKATAPAGVAQVTVEYQAVDPGSYIASSDPAYATAWTTVALNDAGLDGDVQAGDDVYTVTLPGSLQHHRRLIRYRFRASDAGGGGVSAPYSDDPSPNFAYFCYGGVPAWTGAIRPGGQGSSGQPFTVSREEMNRLPVYHLIAKRQAVEDCTWYDRSHGDEYFWEGTLVYDGAVYDHVRFRPRGGVWRYAMGKNMWKFDFNRGHDFVARDNWGRRLGTAWTKLNLGACIQQGDFQHRGEQGLFESVGFRLFQLVGQPAMNTTFVQFRIVDAVEEAPANDQYTGDFWGLYLATEQPDGRFLDEHGLADGNFYKMEGGWGDPNNLGPLGPTDYSDLSEFIGASNNQPTEAWWRANLNLHAYFGYQTIVQAIHHYDIADGKNYFYHRDPATGVWTVVPWDLDLTWADNMYRGGQTGGDEPFKSRLLSNFSTTPAHPGIAREFRNRVREVRDLLWNGDEAFRLIDEYARLVRGTEATSIIDADRAQWDYNPLMSNGSIVNPSKAGTGRFYQLGTPTKDFAGMVQLMKNYVTYRATHPAFSLDTIAAEASLPATPTLTHLGPAHYPANRLQFQVTAFSGTAFGSIQWRLAEVSRPEDRLFNPTEPQAYEIVPSWQSPELTTPTPEFTFPAGVTRIGHCYRARARYTDTAGRASHWSAPIEFIAGPTDSAELVVAHLRLSEIMFNPPAGSDFEFLELHNESSEATLELGGVTFTAGIDLTFAPGTTLAPDQRLLVTRAKTPSELEAFRTHYGLDANTPIVGPYGGSLANEGERLTLKTDAEGATVFSVAYSDGRGWPVAADGAGHSLVPRPQAVAGQRQGWLDYGGNWRASAFLRGSPGRPDPEPEDILILTELMAHTHLTDPEQPEHDSNDWIEVHNASQADLSMAGWYLSDDPTDLRKWALPDQTLPRGASITFDETTGFHTPLDSGFGLNQAGEELFLSCLPGTEHDRVADAVRFEGQERDHAWGRIQGASPYWHRLPPSPGATNPDTEPFLSVSEIMYRPYDHADGANRTDNVLDEFVELHNRTSTTIPLSDTNGVWRLEGGISFTFPTSTALPPDAYLLVVSFDPNDTSAATLFRRKYGLEDRAVTILGPYSGTLGNTTDRVVLEKPLLPDRPGEPAAWVILDEVIYGNGWPWPEPRPDGRGGSLQRLDGATSGNDPTGWHDGWPTPGSASFKESAADFDLDGLPDPWEAQMGLDPANPEGEHGPDGDPDADGLTNRDEFERRTDPQAATLAVLSVRQIGTELELQFNQPAGQAIQLETASSLDVIAWTTLASHPASTNARVLRFADRLEGTSASRFYRVVSP